MSLHLNTNFIANIINQFKAGSDTYDRSSSINGLDYASPCFGPSQSFAKPVEY